jgi:hypothetical protein
VKSAAYPTVDVTISCERGEVRISFAGKNKDHIASAIEAYDKASTKLTGKPMIRLEIE